MTTNAAASPQRGATATVFDAEWNELDSGPLAEVMQRLTTPGPALGKYASITAAPGAEHVIWSGRGA